MTTWRAVLAIALVAFGSVTAVAGPEALATVALAAAQHSDIALLALAIVVFVALAAPKGTLKVPAVIATVGLILLGARYGIWNTRTVRLAAGLALVAVGAWLILAASSRMRDWTDPVQRLTVALVDRELCIPEGSSAPRHLSVTAIGATARVDLRRGMWPNSARSVEIAVNCFAGRVELIVPVGWTVAAGRVHLTSGIRFKGSLDLREPMLHADGLPPQELGQVRRLVIVHVLGALGVVSIPDRKQGHPPSPSDPAPSSLPPPPAPPESLPAD